jgi:hypothetical protein
VGAPPLRQFQAVEPRDVSRCPRQARRHLRQRVRLPLEPPPTFPDKRRHILGLGQRIGRTTWRDIVGDTGEWKEAHEDQVLAMVRPDRLDRAMDYAVEHGCDIFEALDEVRRSEKRWKYRRRPPRRSALPPRRSGEERNTRRYVHPPLLDPAKGYLRHIPPGSKITGARRGLQTEAKLARFTA